MKSSSETPPKKLQRKRSGHDSVAQYGEVTALASLVPCAVLLLGVDMQLRFASPGALQLLGYDNTEALRNAWPETLQKLDLPQIESVPQGQKPLRFRVDCDLTGATRLLRLEVHRLEQGSQGEFLVLLKDRQVLDHVHKQLLLASQMNIQAYLANALVHDLNAPINNIQLTLELLRCGLMEFSDNAVGEITAQRLQRYQSVLKEETQRLSRLIKMLPNSLNPPKSTKDQFDLCEVIEEVMGRLRHEAAAKHIRRSIEMPASELVIGGSRDRIKLALFNVAIVLIENTAMSGNLSIKADKEEGLAKISLCSDAAPGLDERVDGLEHLCFSSSKQSPGLFTARLVIESQGGELIYETLPGRSACFRAILPLAMEANLLRAATVDQAAAH